jgi:hypothetical protein
MRAAWLALVTLLPATAAGQTVSWGAYVDAYYAYQFNQQGPGDAPLLTQPARHNEFNINLAFVEATLSAERVRGRLALQAGTSVQANYAGEPTDGANSGPLLARHIQEAVAGIRVADSVWIDGGIFFSHIGSESWVSRDNWTYTRSLIAEYSPYYESGVKVTWSPGDRLSATFALVNGWQNISENNADKAIGIRVDYSPTAVIALSYANFIGNEQPEDTPASRRYFHDFTARLTFSESAGLLASFDFGRQAEQDWYGFTIVGRAQLSPVIGVAARFERYSDPDAVFLSTPAGPGLRTNGVSVNIDAALADHVVWRSEFRSFFADDVAFRDSDGDLTARNPFVVSSLALTF